MRRYNETRCVARVDGVPCGLTPAYHAVEQRLIRNPKPVGHAFVIAQGANNDRQTETE